MERPLQLRTERADTLSSPRVELTVWNEFLCSVNRREIRQWNQRGDCVKLFEEGSWVVCVTVWKNLLCTSTAFFENLIKLWNSDGNCVRVLEGHTGGIQRLKVWKNLLCSSSYDLTIRLWNETGECLCILQGHDNNVVCLEVWTDFLCSADHSGTINVWNERGDCLKTLTLDSYVQCMTVWKNLLCAVLGWRITMYDSDCNCVRVLHTSGPTRLTVWNDLLFVGDDKGNITVWKWTEKKYIAILKGESRQGIYSMTVWNNNLYFSYYRFLELFSLTPLSSISTQSNRKRTLSIENQPKDMNTPKRGKTADMDSVPGSCVASKLNCSLIDVEISCSCQHRMDSKDSLVVL